MNMKSKQSIVKLITRLVLLAIVLAGALSLFIFYFNTKGFTEEPTNFLVKISYDDRFSFMYSDSENQVFKKETTYNFQLINTNLTSEEESSSAEIIANDVAINYLDSDEIKSWKSLNDDADLNEIFNLDKESETTYSLTPSLTSKMILSDVYSENLDELGINEGVDWKVDLFTLTFTFNDKSISIGFRINVPTEGLSFEEERIIL